MPLPLRSVPRTKVVRMRRLPAAAQVYL